MSTPKQIRTNDLTAGVEVLVRGKVAYSHIASHISGPALDKANQDAIARGRPTHNRPYTTITICDAAVLPTLEQMQQGTYQLTTEQMYVQERLFESKSAGYTNKCYQAESKSPNLPGISVYNPATNTYDPISVLEGELARGMNVTLVMKVFDAKPNKGFGLDSIICNEPIRYFGRQPMAPTLAKYGITLSGEMMSRQPGQRPVEEMPPDANVYPDAGPVPAPGAPAPVPPPAPGTDPYAVQQQSAPYPTQPAPTGAPAGYGQQPPAGYGQAYPPQQPNNGYPSNNAYGQQPPVGQAYTPQPQEQQAPAPAPAGYPAGYGQQPAPAYTPPAAQTYPPQQGADPAAAPAGYPGPFTPPPTGGYPGSNDGIAYNPANDPGRQY